MNYLLYGEEDFLISEEIKKIIRKEKLDDISTINYNLEVDNIKDIIDDCQTISLFEDKKLIVINNCNYFNRVKYDEEDYNKVLDYLNNYNPSTIVIFVSHNSSVDSTKKITKKIKEVGEIIELNEGNSKKYLSRSFAAYKITDECIDLLIERVGNDIAILSEEAEKLKLYKYEEREITKEDVLDCATYNVDTDIFKFIDNIINKRKDEALTTYYELLRHNEEPIKIIGLLASKFRLMYQATTLNKKRLSNNEISSMLGVHAYPVKLAIKVGSKYPEKILLQFIHRLANLDRDIKTGKVNSELGLELFILKL